MFLPIEEKRIDRLNILLFILVSLDVLTTYILMVYYQGEEFILTSRLLIEHSWWLFVTFKLGTILIYYLGVKFVLSKDISYYKLFKNIYVYVNIYYTFPFVWNLYGIFLMKGLIKI